MPKKKRKGFLKNKKFKSDRLRGYARKVVLGQRLDKVTKRHNLDKMISPEFTDRVVNNAGVVENYGDFK
jgi:hypothetical protein